jgi:hypothetical protein
MAARPMSRDGTVAMSISVFFAWYDFWIGLFYDQKKRTLYVCLLPMVVIKIERKQ